MKKLSSYIRLHGGYSILWIGMVLIFLGIGYLYEVSVEYMLYCTLLTGVCYGTFTIVHFSKYIALMEKIEKLNTDSLFTVEEVQSLEGLPVEYATLLVQTRNKVDDLIDQTNRTQQQFEEYYTIWLHQIKTPIAALHFLIESGETNALLLESELFKVEQYMALALEYIRLHSTYHDFVIEQVSVDKLLKGLLKKYAPLFIQKKLVLDYQYSDLVLLTDKKWLALAIEQLLSNAIKYSFPSGKISIFTKDNQLMIQDEGRGIKKEELSRLFKKGYTGFNGRKLHSSSGLGLYICKTIIERLGQKVTLQSEVGKGTCAMLLFDRYTIVTKHNE